MEWLFDASDFVPRGCCGDWSGGLAPVYIASNLGIALAYFTIPAALLYLWRKRRAALPRPDMLLGFAMFVTLCGMTHVADVMVFRWPAYRLFTVVDAVTAVVSLYVACRLPAAVSHLLTLPTPEQHARALASLQTEARRRESLQEQLTERNIALAREADALREQIERLKFRRLGEEEYMDLRKQLHKLRDVS